MTAEGQSQSSRGPWRKLGLSSVIAAAGAGVGLLLTMKPKRLRETPQRLREAVSELPDSARNLVEDLTQRARPAEEAGGRPMPREKSDEYQARRADRRERREQRRQHATR